VLFVRGGLSGYLEEQELPLLRAHFPQAQLETVPQAGHWVHAEQPEAFSRTVMNFLQTIPAPTEPGNS
jgi:pimeloyl-ACP methyl ester carboxylesterase